ncbi:MAG: pitrilysin family protein [candidate division WOR-3 bacterium]|nr:pitrilysin family protein [candidate division WOR-3 bacterium]
MRHLTAICILLLMIIPALPAGEINVMEMDNGIDVIYEYDPSYNISAVSFYFDGGCLNYSEDKAGIEKFLMNMILRGSQKYPLDSLNTLMDNYGIHSDNLASHDYSYLAFSSINKYFPATFEIALDIVKNPSFEEQSMSIVREKMLSDIRSSMEKPDEVIWDELNKRFYGEHPYASKPDGFEETVSVITAGDLKEHLDYLLHNNRVIVSVVSGIEPNKMMPVIKESLKDLKSPKDKSRLTPPPFDEHEKGRFTVDKEGLMTSYVAGKFPVASVKSDEYPALRIGFSILSRKVYELLRTKHGLTYVAFTGVSNRKTNYGYFYVSTDYPDSAISLTLEEFDRAREDGVTEEEIDNIRNLFITSFYIRNEKSMDKSLMSGLDYLLYSDPEYSMNFAESISKLTVEDIDRAFNKYITDMVYIILE